MIDSLSADNILAIKDPESLFTKDKSVAKEEFLILAKNDSPKDQDVLLAVTCLDHLSTEEADQIVTSFPLKRGKLLQNVPSESAAECHSSPH